VILKKHCGCPATTDHEYTQPKVIAMAVIIKADFTRQKEKNRKAGFEVKPAPVYQLKISLAFSDPLIWRRIQVPGDISLARLHDILQLCMGWSDLHTHRFLIGKVFYAPSLNGEFQTDTGERCESEYTLVTLENDMKWVFTYIYDFGDGWEHEIELEESIPAGQGVSHPVLLNGERACPPENVGGIPGYEEFLNIINNPHHEHHRRIAAWYGADRFDPGHFDMARINKSLKGL
jgi:hypothetical protein